MVKHASDDYTRTVERFLAGMSPPIVVTNVGAADHLFECATETTESAITAAKAKFNRTRPYRLPNNDLQVLKAIKANDAPSFPSSHSAFGTVTGLILVEMVPELRERISARIKDFALSRLISGVHFRSDVYAGEVAGAAIAASFICGSRLSGRIGKSEARFAQGDRLLIRSTGSMHFYPAQCGSWFILGETSGPARHKSAFRT